MTPYPTPLAALFLQPPAFFSGAKKGRDKFDSFSKINFPPPALPSPSSHCRSLSTRTDFIFQSFSLPLPSFSLSFFPLKFSNSKSVPFSLRPYPPLAAASVQSSRPPSLVEWHGFGTKVTKISSGGRIGMSFFSIFAFHNFKHNSCNQL